jgi:hypothetical protein
VAKMGEPIKEKKKKKSKDKSLGEIQVIVLHFLLKYCNLSPYLLAAVYILKNTPRGDNSRCHLGEEILTGEEQKGEMRDKKEERGKRKGRKKKRK